jgi:hypothetical protein
MFKARLREKAIRAQVWDKRIKDKRIKGISIFDEGAGTSPSFLPCCSRSMDLRCCCLYPSPGDLLSARDTGDGEAEQPFH